MKAILAKEADQADIKRQLEEVKTKYPLVGLTLSVQKAIAAVRSAPDPSLALVAVTHQLGIAAVAETETVDLDEAMYSSSWYRRWSKAWSDLQRDLGRAQNSSDVASAFDRFRDTLSGEGELVRKFCNVCNEEKWVYPSTRNCPDCGSTWGSV